ncbi:MAG: hypothetical protein JNK82_38245 [Myxococcaceae bacterium]|nr:hypothetical protein [Myxococcaceae bacterium]
MKRVVALLLLTACPTLPGIEDAGSDAGFDAGRPPGPPAIDVATGATHACARMVDGTVRCWGCYCSGGLLQTLTPDSLPVTIAGVRDTKQLALGLDLTCALMQNDTVKCWGRGGAGQLGNGATDDSDTAVDVANLTGVLEIAAGDRHVCARKNDGTVWCWGDNRERQLGDGTVVAQQLEPASLGGPFGASQLDLGKTHSCAQRASGQPVCWGDNAQGQVGDGTMMSRNTPTPVMLPGVSGSRVTAGALSCLLRDERGVSCWGGGAATPVERFSSDGGWVEVAAGGATVCARAGSTVSCLDAGTVEVPNAVQLAAGDRYTCARTDGGQVFCWGKNDVGQLGDGRQGAGADSDVPVKVGF